MKTRAWAFAMVTCIVVGILLLGADRVAAQSVRDSHGIYTQLSGARKRAKDDDQGMSKPLRQLLTDAEFLDRLRARGFDGQHPELLIGRSADELRSVRAAVLKQFDESNRQRLDAMIIGSAAVPMKKARDKNRDFEFSSVSDESNHWDSLTNTLSSLFSNSFGVLPDSGGIVIKENTTAGGIILGPAIGPFRRSRP